MRAGSIGDSSSSNGLSLLVCLFVAMLMAGCGARVIKLDQKGLSCTEAQSLSITAVRKMGYGIDETLKPLPGTPGVVRASRMVGAQRQGVFLQVYCTTLGAEVEAKTEDAGFMQMGFPTDFSNAFKAAVEARPGQRAAMADGLDVTVNPGRSDGSPELPVDLSRQGVFVAQVRIVNHTNRLYKIDLKEIVLTTTTGERVKPLGIEQVTHGLTVDATDTVRGRALVSKQVEAGTTVDGFAFFPMNPYTGARVSLTDVATDEPEGFAINF